MFWQWCRKVFSNLAMRGIVPFSEVPFVFNSVCLTGEREREREREREYIQKSNSEIDVPERRVRSMVAFCLPALNLFVSST
jgi:hypothetical protein